MGPMVHGIFLKLQSITVLPAEFTGTPSSLACDNIIHFINLKRIMRGPRGPRKTSMDDPAAIIGTQEPIFHLIIHNIGPLCHAA